MKPARIPIAAVVCPAIALASIVHGGELADPVEVIQNAKDAGAGRADPGGGEQLVLVGRADPARQERIREGRRIADALLLACTPAFEDAFAVCLDRVLPSYEERFRDVARAIAMADNAIRWKRHEEQRLDRALAACKKAGFKPGSVYIGMSRQQVLDCGWGHPTDVIRTSTARTVHEQWVYRDRSYLYFDNDKLTAIQD